MSTRTPIEELLLLRKEGQAKLEEFQHRVTSVQNELTSATAVRDDLQQYVDRIDAAVVTLGR